MKKVGSSRSPRRTFQEFGLTKEMDQGLQHFLASGTDEETLEVIRGVDRESGLEEWRRPAALCDPVAAGRSLDDSMQNDTRVLRLTRVRAQPHCQHIRHAWQHRAPRHCSCFSGPSRAQPTCSEEFTQFCAAASSNGALPSPSLFSERYLYLLVTWDENEVQADDVHDTAQTHWDGSCRLTRTAVAPCCYSSFSALE